MRDIVYKLNKTKTWEGEGEEEKKEKKRYYIYIYIYIKKWKREAKNWGVEEKKKL